ncbi:EscC/YscC/HrcC family type III secretion system outer membrane ring protein, partial [Salmonella enterica]
TGLTHGGPSRFATVSSDTSNFMARSNALDKRSPASALSPPSVVNLNNLQAALDQNISVYTQLQGEKAAYLESI